MADFNPQPVNQPQTVDRPPEADKTFYQSNKFYIWAIAVAVLIIAGLAYLAFRPARPVPPQEANVMVDIQGPESLPSGSEVIYRINLKNNDHQKLTSLELELTYPEGVSFIESSPKPANVTGSIFQIPDLSPAQNASVIIKAKAAGAVNAQLKLLARLHYKYTNFNSNFLKSAEHTLRLTASDVILELTGPLETTTAQLVQYSIYYKNNSKDTIKNARIRLTYPTGFNYAASQPAASFGGNVWNLADLQSGAEGKITLQGTFQGSGLGEEKKFVAELETLGAEGKFFAQTTAEYKTVITSMPLIVNLENLTQGGEEVVDPGEVLDFAVHFKNNAAIAASGVNLAVTLDSVSLDWTSLQAQGANIVGNTITWNAASVPAFLSLNPGESGSLNFSIRVRNPAANGSKKNLDIKISTKIKANEYSTFLPGESVILKISSPVQMRTELTFASGSLPPKVGTQTKYRAKITLTNSSNDFSEGLLTAFLPGAGGSFSYSAINQAEKDKVKFDPQTGRLSWKLGMLPAYAGKALPAKILEFEVIANPGPADAGQSVTLVKNIRFTARDEFTGQQIDLDGEELTTASLTGESGYSKGVVIP